LLRAALGELQVGDPAQLATDIGPVIDETARAGLLAHIERMRQRGRAVFQVPTHRADTGFVPPTLIEIDTLTELGAEVFGPVVHVLRFAGDRLEPLVDAINGMGYGLTLGIHSRIDETIASITGRARIGNIYVNRNMVGAVVGVQPFGGERLSGTGPKAGGPLYLPRLADCAAVDLASQPGRSQAHPAESNTELQQLAEWAASSERRELARLCSDYAGLSLLHTRFALPGPTGERNQLNFAPRGLLLCTASDEADWLEQIAAALATGNRIAAVDGATRQKLSALLPTTLASHIEWRQPGNLEHLNGVLLARDDPALRRQLAAGDGALTPVYLPDQQSRRYPLQRLLVERVISTNITAAGGNTTLMTLAA
jgi:RHH-type proline utilization regulon transcriptional repressor/proline dehydrogenase/delta 1-pyrroline-5-carboxylate dehydrogenase